MSPRTVSRDDFRGLFALYSFAARHDHDHDGASRLLNLFISSRSIPDDLLNRWSEAAEGLGPEAVGHMLRLRAHAVADGDEIYDHASAFLHALLQAFDSHLELR